MIAAFVLPPALRARIENEARAAAPRECCGLIEGARDGDIVRAIALHPARNLADGTDRFEIDPRDHFAAVRAARANGHKIVGCYHSHLNGLADMSERDRDGASDDGFVWLICAIAAQSLQTAAFVRENARFIALELRETASA
ncbi:MAG TPA: M67 family metallopeptidase [Rhizomicrobium sp.]|nr:M67 family metallopeptidase [Rhizomicrobium sp.]